MNLCIIVFEISMKSGFRLLSSANCFGLCGLSVTIYIC